MSACWSTSIMCAASTVTFFGRQTKANPLIARLARQVECPIHGVRMVRMPNHRFFVELTPEVPPVRDAEGKIDVQGTMQAITSVVEGWIREHPEQWLWLHRRWRYGRALHFPVLTLVHSRLMMRWVFASRAVTI